MCTVIYMERQIILKPLRHGGQECIGIYFELDFKINGAIRKNAGARWSATEKAWYVPMSRENYNKLVFAVKGKGIIEHSALHSYLSDKKKSTVSTIPSAIFYKPGLREEIAIPQSSRNVTESKARESYDVSVYKSRKIFAVNAHVLPAMMQKLKLKAYSSSTIRTYLGEMSQLLMLLKHISADDLQPEHLRRYLVYCFEKLSLTENSLHSRINAMKFYYEQVLGRDRFFWDIPRPKKQLILPKILSESEMGRLFQVINNLKHKAIVFAAYSAGLRVSEVINLRIKDVDSCRMTLYVEKAKGKKDRIVNLSPLLLDILRNYLLTSNPRPLKYLFEGEISGMPYSVRSAQQIFHDAKRAAGINKEVSFHGLRHSFATHLLEKGVDIRYIKDILGHFNIKTTERYTHVSKRMLVNIGSPLDDLFSKGFI